MHSAYDRRVDAVYDALNAGNWRVRRQRAAAIRGRPAARGDRARMPPTSQHAPPSQAASKTAAAALGKHPADAQLSALRALALQRLGQGADAVQVR